MATLYQKVKRRKSKDTPEKRRRRGEWSALKDRLDQLSFSVDTRLNAPKTKPRTSLIQQQLDRHKDRLTSNIPSAVDLTPVAPKQTLRYEGEMADRQKAAEARTEQLKKQVAPLYNKGPAAFIGGYDPKDLGKKT